MKKKYFTEEEKREAIRIKNKKAYEKNKSWHIEYVEKHKEERKEYHKNWFRLNNPNKIKEVDPEKIKLINRWKKNEYQKNRKKTDMLYRLKCNVRSYLCNTLKNKKDKTCHILGCSFEEFKNHIESLWQPWMNWGNYGLYNGEFGYGWDIDHIVPISSANTEEQIIRLNHYSNLQPLCSKINRYIKKDSFISKKIN